MKQLLLVAMLGLSLSAKAAVGIGPISQPDNGSNSAGCIPASEMTQIAKDFTQFSNLSGKEFCNDNSQTAYLLAGIEFIRKVQFTQPMTNSADQLFKNNFSGDWNKYLTNLIHTFQIEQSCPVGVIAFVYGFFHQNTMHVCPAALTNAFTPLDLASVFMHEARHIEGYPHTTCSQGPRAGLNGACDSKISDTGSYDVTVETYAQLGQYGKDINPAYRALAQASSFIYAAEAFQTPVQINKDEAFLALNTDREMYQIDSGLKAATKIGATANFGHIAKSKMGLILIPEDKNLPMSRVFITGETTPIAGEYNDNAATRGNVVDYYFAWTWNARIEKNKVQFFCDKRQNPTQSVVVQLGAGEALSVVYPEGYTPEKNYAYVTTTKGTVKISCEGSTGQIVAANNVTVDTDLKRVHKAGSTMLGLTNDGQLLNLSANSKRVDLGLGTVVDVTSFTRATFFDKK
ncbi:hypothetical protein CIK05_14540 [Bdellovibrio sp. qaytius]|nr:hypothetical protein CIK05_14540 [Bdellovibrio sp. qaytius]